MVSSLKRSFLTLRILALLGGLCFTFANCKKDKVVTESKEVKVDKIEPASGPHSTLVAVTGSGFSATAGENIVMFNGKNATVQDASPTLLHVIVPKAAGTGPVTVERTGKKGTGPSFNFIWTTTTSAFAGNGNWGYTDGNGDVAQFIRPHGLGLDAAGNIYVADFYNHRIRKITPEGVVSKVAGSGVEGSQDGPANSATFSEPADVAVDPTGNIYVAEHSRIRKITPSGVVSTVASKSPINTSMTPAGLASDKQGNIFVADRSNACIWKITPSGSMTLFAGGPVTGFENGPGVSAKFNAPTSVAIDKDGNLYVTDLINNAIRKITPSAEVSTLAGGGSPAFADGTAAAAKFNYPEDIAVDAEGNVYVGDEGNERVRKITPAGVVTTLAGTGEPGYKEGDPATAKFYAPWGVAVDAKGIIYVADGANHRIRKIVSE